MVCAGAKPSLRLASCCKVEGVKGARGLPPRGFGLGGGDGEVGGLDRLLEVFGFGAGADIETLDLLAVGADQPRLERLAARRRQGRDQRPVFSGYEFLDF